MKGAWLVLVLALGGCASNAVRDDALAEFGRTGRAIQPYLKDPSDKSVESLYKAFDRAITECEKFGVK